MQTLFSRDRQSSRQAIFIVGLLLTLGAIVLQFEFFLCAGGLWRDEANSAAMAEAMPNLAWTDLQFDSFPVGWPLLLRAWITVAGTSDRAYRLFGFLVGLALLFAIWLAARIAGHRIPGAALLLAGLNGGVTRTVSSIRGYGAAIASAIFLIAALRALVNRATKRRHLLVLLLSLASAHLLYQNCVLVLAAITAAAVVMILERRVLDAAWVVSCGIATALSMIVYIPVVRSCQSWISILSADYDLSWFWEKTKEAILFSGPAAPAVWIVLTAVTVAISMHVVRESIRDQRNILFGVTMLLVGIPAYFVFFKVLGLLTSWWYYVPLLAVVAVAIEMVCHAAVDSRHASAFGGALILLALVFFPASVSVATMRQTNVDLVAGEIARQATDDDLVVVSGWPLGVSYRRYHRSRARWQTAPPMRSHDWHRWDEATAKAQDPHAMDSLIDAIGQTLGKGGRLFVVALRPFGKTAATPLPTFRGTIRQSSGFWERQLHHALTSRGSVVVAESRPGRRVISLENLTLQVWRRAPGSERGSREAR